MTLIPGKIVFSCNSIKYGKCGGLLFLQAGLYFIGTQRAMGINGLTIGTDSGDDDTLALAGKGYTAADILEQCRKLDRMEKEGNLKDSGDKNQ